MKPRSSSNLVARFHCDRDKTPEENTRFSTQPLSKPRQTEADEQTPETQPEQSFSTLDA